MITLTKTELLWLAELAGKDALENKKLAANMGNSFYAVHQLRADNMNNLTLRLQTAATTGDKRISIK